MKKSRAAEVYAHLSPLFAWIIGGIAVAVGLPVLGHWIVFRLEQAAREKTLNE